MPTILGQSTTSTRPIYMDFGVSLFCFKKNFTRNVIAKLHFPNYVFEQNISFSIYK